MTCRLIARSAVLAMVVSATDACAERAPEQRSQATHVVLGTVGWVYVREAGNTRYYLVEIAVESVEKGEGVKPGETFYVRCYLWNLDYYKGKKLSEAEQKSIALGTYISRDEPASPSAPRVSLVAGSGQRLHELEVEEPETYHQTGAIAELHKLVKKRLRLK